MLRKQLSILSSFLRRFSLVDLKLDQQTVKSASGVVARVMSNPGREYAIYLDGDGPAEIALDLPRGNYAIEWMSVKTGVTERSDSIHHSNGTKVLQSPKFSGGIALRIVSAK
jgi:hypothetical protein